MERKTDGANEYEHIALVQAHAGSGEGEQVQARCSKQALIQVNLEMECFNSAYDMKGTSTTDKPVMKPALDVVVYRRPAV